ncbi:NAD-dependent epimerase/dehydratase family protein [Parablautia muri]|uniref:NAD(P)-dependent oxidoreductase n=1 Tax=Parablautia muri TaxID=2320879 RepID=A0A9X5BF58_9FIRM|nr:NAD(P)-dependent oxidoreductase [Parablautia muri]NBJ92503.1 NAD(P)-dependent oxidoreductase [Parablautia muri]
MKKNLVIAGGTSFIARNLMKELDLERYEITSFVREKVSSQEKGEIRYIPLKMEEYNNIANYISKCDCYIPFTWNGTKRRDRNNRRKNEESYQHILSSIRIMIEKCGCSKVLLPGTFSEYKNLYVPINESTACDSNSEYGKFKHKLYEDAYEMCMIKGVKLIEVRLFSIYGEDDSVEKMLNQILIKMLKNEEIFLTLGEQIWDFLYVSDVVSAFRKLIDADVESGCYNVATNEHRTLKSYIEEMKAVTESTSKLHFGAIPYETDAIPHMICVTDKISKAIDWKPEIEFSDGIKKMQHYYQEKLSIC